ncbi:sensor histidine kinase [Ekhidna sp.]|uniref:sensor histidine kinase n=1 Tax=Ekhidna sp. TaxID=2608089 RepID=UPI003B5A4E74
MKYVLLLTFLVSAVLILRQYTDYLINEYEYDFSWYAVSIKIIINYLLWALFFRFLVRISDHLLSNRINLTLIAKHIAISLGVSAIHRLLATLLYDYSFFFYTGYLRSFLAPTNKVAMGAGLFSSFLEYWVIMILIMAISYYSRYVQQQKELSTAKLDALKMQLQPHFLFNTLNSITSLIDIDSKKAQKMLSQLGFLMRELLEHDKKLFIPLESEMEYIKTYLEIEHIRFQDRLKLNFEIENETLTAKVPALLLQPIVENAIKHGIAKIAEGGAITVQTTKTNADEQPQLAIIISNDVPQANGQVKSEGYGIGIENVSNRLEHLYGSDYTYSQSSEKDIFTTKITLPFEPI